jgi:class 3 adenylate cyclase/tetratricopeptide (TPR) repeat protein
MDVGVWLRQLGLGQYEAAFRDNEIDADVLADLTEADLEKLGLPLGHRKRLIKAIANLGKTEDLLPGAPRPAPASAHPTDSAERRHVTVMFTDLVGSTALSTRMDPEDLRKVIGAYHRCVAETISRFDGFVAKYMGDGVLIYFGYPAAHEDDAERAVRAGLALIDAVASLASFEPLQVRIGAATGLVVVGDLVGSGEAQERGIVGETPNLAARLQSAADKGTIVIDPTTHRLVGNLFEYRELGNIEVKGFTGHVKAYQVVRAISVESRFEALRAATTPLIGREEETELLQRRWKRAKAGDGSLVLISGEPGIGKSRITAWLLEHVAHEPHTRMRYFCSPRHADSAFYPIVGQLERAAGFKHDDDPTAKLDKLDTLLARTSTRPEDASLIADLMSLPIEGRFPALDLTPQQRRQRTLDALIGQVGELAKRQPLLLIFEDIHWIDPSSLELVSRAIDRMRTRPMLFVVTFRPEFDPPWVGQSNVTSLVLSRLGRSDVHGMIERIIGNQSLPDDIVAEIIDRTDGVPLFVEEMTNAILEVGEAAASGAAAAIPSAAHAVPATLHASLMARLDRLGAAKEVAQIGAAIGREFPYETIAAVSSLTEPELQSALNRLKHAGLLLVQGTPPYATFLFKHALIQDAAYGTLLREARRNLHLRIATALTERSPQIAETQPEILAHHYTEAGDIARAARFWGAAGQRSSARSAYSEAITQLTRALHQLASLPANPEIRRERLKLQVTFASTLIHAKGYTSPDTIGACQRAIAMIEEAEGLGEHPEDPLLRFSAMYGLWAASHVAADLSTALARAEQFLSLAEQLREPVAGAVGHRLKGAALTLRGQIELATVELNRAIDEYRPQVHRPLATRFGQDVRTAALSYRALASWMRGHQTDALHDADDALRSARELGQAGTLMHTLFHTALPVMLSGQVSTAEQRAEDLASLANEKGAPLWIREAQLLKGWILVANGHASDAINVLSETIDYRMNSLGSNVWNSFFNAVLAFACASRGALDRAEAIVGDTIRSMDATHERWAEAEIHRLAGEISCLAPDPEQAEARFRRSIAIAREQSAKSWELRSATSLARLFRDRGRREEANHVLAPVYGWFDRGMDTSDLKAAKALLDAL